MEIRRTRAAGVCISRSTFQRSPEKMRSCSVGQSRSTAFARSGAWRAKIFSRAHYRVRWSALATVVSPAQRGRACGKHNDRGRRTGRRLFRHRSLLDRLVGRSLRRSAARAEIRARPGRFVFYRNRNARWRGTGKALRFSHRDECLGTSRSNRAAMRSLFGG